MIKKFPNFLILLVVMVFCQDVLSQSWQWDWVRKINHESEGSSMWVTHIDFYNNMYCRTPYSGTIYIGDTTFTSGNDGNYVISKYDNRGDFIKAINLRGDDVYYPEVITDRSGNWYIAGNFSHHMWVQDSLIVMKPGSSNFHPEVFLYKLNADNEILWTGLISNQWSDDFRSMCVSPDDNSIYLATEHYANGDPHVLNFFDQDTSAPYYTPLNSLVKVDTNCNLVWRKEIRSEYLGTGCRTVFVGGDNHVYLFGSAYADFHIGNDTVYHPTFYPGGEVKMMHYLVSFDHDGNYLEGFFFDSDIWFYEFEINDLGDLYIAGTIYDTAVIGQDTVAVPDGLYYSVIGKFTKDMQPIWYDVIEEGQNQTVGFRSVEILDNHLFFGGSGDGNVTIGDTTLVLGANYVEALFGEYSPDGELLNIVATECQRDLMSWNMLLDNCNNLIVSGMFNRQAIWGNDTLNSQHNNFEDGYVAKLNRTVLEELNLGSDTTVCDILTLEAPQGYLHYVWNDQLTDQPWLDITESGTYTLACGNDDGCWRMDTIKITIDHIVDPELGPDTTILESGYLVLGLDEPYDSYLWSDGSTSSQLFIVGSEYGVGFHTLWIEVSNGTCMAQDTMILEIKSPGSISEQKTSSLPLYPNPVEDHFYFELGQDYQSIAIYTLNGTPVRYQTLKGQAGATAGISMADLQSGVYMVKVKTSEGVLVGKVCKH